MKKIALLFALAIAVSINPAHAEKPYAEGMVLHIAAQSGLTLRMEPSLKADAILVLPFGDPVTVLNTFEFSLDKADRISWMDGHWVMIDYYGLQGYVFDAFLTSMPTPSHESEYCIGCEHIIFPLINYLEGHFDLEVDSSRCVEKELISQIVLNADSCFSITTTKADGWFRTEIEFEEYRLCEVLNLIRSMAWEKYLKSDLENSMVFKEGKNGKIKSVEIKMYENPIRIYKTDDGKVKLVTTVIGTELGC